MKIPSPFARRPRRDEPPERDVVLDVEIPFGVHPMVDFVRFTLILMRNQAELTELVEKLARRYNQMRNVVLALSIMSLFASLMQAAQLWLNWR